MGTESAKRETAAERSMGKEKRRETGEAACRTSSRISIVKTGKAEEDRVSKTETVAKGEAE